jgi:hypothetical protein
MTRAARDCTSEHGKDYFDSRLMSDMAIFQQRSAQRDEGKDASWVRAYRCRSMRCGREFMATEAAH